MATKKKLVKPSKPASKKAPKKVAAARESVAVKLLGQLPALDNRLRSAFLQSFTVEQCEAWGTRTKAAEVLREATGWMNTLSSVLKRQNVAGYSLARLSLVCELLVELEDEVAATTRQAEERESQQGARTSALAVARRARNDLSDRLKLVAGGRADLSALISERNAKGDYPGAVRDALAGLLDLATKWRRDPTLELLCDDAEVTAAKLSSAFNAQDALGRTDDVLRDATLGGGDAASVNRIEGRVLRELRLAQRAFSRARDAGLDVPALVAGPTLRRGFNEGNAKPASAPTAAPTPAQ